MITRLPRDNIVETGTTFIDPSDDIDRNNATLPPLEETDELLGSVMEFLLQETTSLDGKAQKPTTKQGRTTTTKTTATPTEKTTGKKKRVRSPASSSTVLQRRKKAEILSLRQQATELQTLLNQLLSPDASSAAPKLNAKKYADAKARGQRLSRWQRSALEQYEMRCKSQKLNRQLKKIASQQRNNGVHRCMAQLAHAVDKSKPNVLHSTEPVTLHHLDESLQFEKLHYLRKVSEPGKG
uniref:Uncharacterized protein n=1 Tax=Phytophthora ramorum TaxID=164328 RepID=H3GPW2_PHYRM